MDFLGTATPSTRRLQTAGFARSSVRSNFHAPVTQIRIESALRDAQLLRNVLGAQFAFPVQSLCGIGGGLGLGRDTARAAAALTLRWKIDVETRAN